MSSFLSTGASCFASALRSFAEADSVGSDSSGESSSMTRLRDDNEPVDLTTLAAYLKGESLLDMVGRRFFE